MESGLLLLINLVAAIALVLVVIVVLRWGPLVALVLGSLSMGLGSGLGVEETVRQISGGFGELMAGIGLSVGLGVIIGRLLFDCGGAHAVATAVVRRVPGRWAFYGLGLTAFLFSIPVFFDVTFVILIPLALALATELGRFQVMLTPTWPEPTKKSSPINSTSLASSTDRRKLESFSFHLPL